MGITSGKKSNHQPEEEDESRSYFGDLPEIIEECIELFGEDDPLTLEYKQELISLTQEKWRRENNPSHYEEEEEEEWHAGMVPNLRPKSEKGLEEAEDWDDEDSEEDEDSEDGPALNPEASKAEPDLSPMSKAGGDPT